MAGKLHELIKRVLFGEGNGGKTQWHGFSNSRRIRL